MRAPWGGRALELGTELGQPVPARAAVPAILPVQAPVDRTNLLDVFSIDTEVKKSDGTVLRILRRPWGFPLGPLPGDPGPVPIGFDTRQGVCHVLSTNAAAPCLRAVGTSETQRPPMQSRLHSSQITSGPTLIRRQDTGATGRLDRPARVGRERQASQESPAEPTLRDPHRSRSPQMTGSSRSAGEERMWVVDDGIREFHKVAMRRGTTARVPAAVVALASLSSSPAPA